MDLHWDEYDVESPSIYTHSCPVLPLSSLMYKHGFLSYSCHNKDTKFGIWKGRNKRKEFTPFLQLSRSCAVESWLIGFILSELEGSSVTVG